MPRWSYEEKDVLDKVKLALPDEWKLRVFQVVSGDTGKSYFIQVLKNEKVPTSIVLCDCLNAKFQLPLAVLGIKDALCKHSLYLLPLLKAKEGRK